MAFGGDSRKDLDEFEKRLSTAMDAIPAQDPDMARFEQELARAQADQAAIRSNVFDFAQESEAEQEVSATVTQSR